MTEERQYHTQSTLVMFVFDILGVTLNSNTEQNKIMDNLLEVLRQVMDLGC